MNRKRQVYNDMDKIEIYNIQHNLEEDRYNTIGMAEDSPELTPEMGKAFRLAAKNQNRLSA